MNKGIDKVRHEHIIWLESGQRTMERENGQRRDGWVILCAKHITTSQRVALNWNTQGKRKRGRIRRASDGEA